MSRIEMSNGSGRNALLGSNRDNDYRAIQDNPTHDIEAGGISNTNYRDNRFAVDKVTRKHNEHAYKHLIFALILCIIYLIYSCIAWIYFLFYEKDENGEYFESHISNTESFMVADFCWLFATLLTLMQWTCNIDPSTLQRQRYDFGACARCSASLGDILILILVFTGIVFDLFGALDLNQNHVLTLELFYFAMFANHCIWCIICVLFYFVPLTFLSNQFRLLKLYSFIIFLVSIFLCMGYVDMIEYHSTISEKWSKIPTISWKNYKLQISGMIVGLTGMSMVALFANFWMPNCFGPNPLTRVTLTIKVINSGLIMFLAIYCYAAETFFGWFGLYGTEMSFVLAVLIIQVNVWQDNILHVLTLCQLKYCGICTQLWNKQVDDTRNLIISNHGKQQAEEQSVNSKSGIVGMTSVDDSKDDHLTLSQKNKTLTHTIPTEELPIVRYMDREREKIDKEKKTKADSHKTRMQLARRGVNHTNNVIVIGVCFILFGIILVFLYKIVFDSIYYLLTLFAFLIIVLLVLFPLKVVLANVINIIGSLEALDINSKYYSAVEPMPPPKDKLPHVTVQIPVYTEDLVDVIEPTVRDVMKAMKYYRKMGGTCNLFINDDGLNGKLTKADVKKRLKYYKLGNIGYVARPVANRPGLFKKASNMNYCIDVSCKTMKLMQEMAAIQQQNSNISGISGISVTSNKGSADTTGTDDNKLNVSGINSEIDIDGKESKVIEIDDVTQGFNNDKNNKSDTKIQNKSKHNLSGYPNPLNSHSIKQTRIAVNAPVSPLMTEALKQVSEEKNNEFLAGGDITIGDLVLLLDADTRLSEKCIYQTVGEFKDPQVAFTQHHTQSMRYDFNYWENVIAFFTNHVYDIGISEACALGDVSPLVGHNAMLRVEALRRSAIDSAERVGGSREIWWSETHVSEDFECVLRFMKNGYYGRYVTYTTYDTIEKLDEWREREIKESFLEGVSLTYQDEQIRLRKYAYGCCEIMFNKISDWPCKGLFSKIFIDFLQSSIPFASKFSILSYMGTYYAMGLAMPLTVFTCLLVSFQTDSHTVNTKLHDNEAFRIAYFIDANINPYDIFLQVTVLFSAYVPFTAAMFYYRRDHNQTSFLYFFYLEIKSCILMWFFWTSILYPIMTSILMYFFNTNVSWGATRKSIDYEHGYNSISELKWIVKANKFQFIFMILLFAGWMMYHHLLSIAWTKNDIPILFAISGHILAPFVLNPVITRMKY